MNANDIGKIFADVDKETKDIIGTRLKTQLSAALKAVNGVMVRDKKTTKDLSPQPELIMNAFRLCPWNKIRVVIIGQDPFINLNEATGLCFSVPRGVSIPPSTKRIYEALRMSGFISADPSHGDLSNWAKQGVLMINSALTTVLKKSNSHAREWAPYTDAIIKEISDSLNGIVFILLGNFAQEKAEIIDAGKHTILEWGHPSPMSSYNKSDNPKNFKYCTVFTRANEILTAAGNQPIDWDPDGNLMSLLIPQAQLFQLGTFTMSTVLDDDPIPLTTDTLWIFTDGAAKANGRSNCTASWGVFITDGSTRASAYDLVEPVDIPDKQYKTSNNRGELTAILRALTYVSTYNGTDGFCYEKIKIISDSEYSVMGVDTRSAEGKANADLLIPAKELLAALKEKCPVMLERIPHHSHEKAPVDTESEEWFLWKGNTIADKLCEIPLGVEKK